jgi:MFS transporter, NNP family, nitrate/nitrite transporter
MEKQKLPSYRWVILTIVSLLCLIANYIQFQVSALATAIMPQLHITTAQFSSLLMAPMLVAVILSIPAGSLGDKFGSKKVITVGCILSVIGAFGRFIAQNFAMMMVMLLLCGIFISLLNANLIKVLGTWFKQETDSAMGVFYAASCLGIVFAQVTSSWFSSVNAAYMFSSVSLLVLTICWILFVRDTPKGEALPPAEPTLQYLKVALKSRNTWIVSICAGLGIASTTAYAGFLPQALSLGQHINNSTAGIMSAVVTIGSFFGSLIGPTWCNKLGQYKLFLTLTTLIGAIVMYFTWYTPAGLFLWIMLVINGFFTAISGPVVQAMPIQFPEIGEKYSGSAGGIVGTVSMLISYIIPILVSMVAGNDYAKNLGIESVIFGLSILCILALPELGKKAKK